MERYSAQRYLWRQGQVELGQVERTYASNYRDAAEQIVGQQLVEAGPLDRLAVKVWRYGEAKRDTDVVRYWLPLEAD